MVAFDSTILSIPLFPDAELHQGGKIVEHARERVVGLVRELESAKEQILVPAPALCEVLVIEGVPVPASQPDLPFEPQQPGGD